MSAARPATAWTLPPLSDDEFEKLRALVRAETGIALNDSKRALVASRLASRLRALGLATFSDYHRVVTREDPDGEERRRLVNQMTTNKTEFFRERHQLDLLEHELAPAWGRRQDLGGNGAIRIWSAGCSTGEEPWSIAMSLASALPGLESRDVSILATDIDTDVLAEAEAAIYPLERTAGIEPARLRRFFLKGRGDLEGCVRVRPELRRLVEFRQLNFVAEEWGIEGPFDAIFCRNVSIYFDGPTQRRLFERLTDLLAPGGYLLVGHSECLYWLDERFEASRGGVYRLRDGNAPRRSRRARATPVPPTTPAAPAAETPGPGSDPRAGELVSIVLGELHASAGDCTVRTHLGSCVAACLHDPVARVGGMNHFLLPEAADADPLSGRYGVHAMELLVNALMGLGADRRRLVAKVFGASELLCGALGAEVARRNAEFVLRFLETDGIPVAASLLRQRTPLEVHFDCGTGRARVRRLSRIDESVTALQRALGEAAPSSPSAVLFGDEGGP